MLFIDVMFVGKFSCRKQNWFEEISNELGQLTVFWWRDSA